MSINFKAVQFTNFIFYLASLGILFTTLTNKTVGLTLSSSDSFYKETQLFVQKLIDDGLLDLDKYREEPLTKLTLKKINIEFSNIVDCLAMDKKLLTYITHLLEEIQNETN